MLFVKIYISFIFFRLVSSCGSSFGCVCYENFITCQDSNLNQIPYFSTLQTGKVSYLNMRNNRIEHPRGDMLKSKWPLLETINLMNNPINCRSNITVLQDRFRSVLTDDCSGKILFFICI